MRTLSNHDDLIASMEPPENPREEIERSVRMLETWSADLFPANPLGQVHMARAMMESAAHSIRQFLATLGDGEAVGPSSSADADEARNSAQNNLPRTPPMPEDPIARREAEAAFEAWFLRELKPMVGPWTEQRIKPHSRAAFLAAYLSRHQSDRERIEALEAEVARLNSIIMQLFGEDRAKAALAAETQEQGE